MLDGAADTNRLVERAAEIGQPAIAQTNHGNMFGAHRFWKACKTNGVIPIIGLEAYVAPESRLLKSKVDWGKNDEGRNALSGGGAYTHLTLLSTGSVGARNLFRLTTQSFSDGFYTKPRIDIELLGGLQEGLLVGSGCLSGELLTRLSLGDRDGAEQYVRRIKDVFGDKFFIEIMDHGFERETKHLDSLLSLGRKYGIKCIATNDSHYITNGDSLLHDAMLCLQTFSKLDDPKRMSFDGSGYYLKSRSEMESLSLPREALDNTLWVAEQVSDYDEIFKHQTRMPLFEVPEGDENDWEREMVDMAR